MTSPPRLTDRRALMRNRRRAGASADLFLQNAAFDEVQDRLMMVNKTFRSPAVVAPFPHVWRGFEGATVVEDTETLALEEGAHDLVIHAMGLHWANDPVGQMIQCRRALKPDGLLIAVTLGGQTLHELRASLGQAEIEVSGGLSPRVAPMGELRDLGSLLQRAGLALPVADSFTLNVAYQTPLHLMRDLRAMGEANALENRRKTLTPRAILSRASEIYAENFPGDDGRVAATFEIVTLTGWAPDPGQPQPLRPGSAAQRLSDALNTVETPLKD